MARGLAKKTFSFGVGLALWVGAWVPAGSLGAALNASSATLSSFSCTPGVFSGSVTTYDNSSVNNQSNGDLGQATQSQEQGGPLSACQYPALSLPGGTTQGTQYYAAMEQDLFTKFDLCGACCLITNPANGQSVTVVITDECPVSGNAPCANGNNHIDLSYHAISQINGGGSNYSFNVNWQVVPCPLSYFTSTNSSGTSNITYSFKGGASSGWAALIIRDHVMPIQKVSYCTGSGSGCTPATWNTAYNGWVPNSGTWNSFYLQITDDGGNVGNFGPINCCSPTSASSTGPTNSDAVSIWGNAGGQMPSCGAQPSPTYTTQPSPTRTVTPSATRTTTPSVTFTSSATRTASPSATRTISSSATPTATVTPSATRTASPSATSTPINTATVTMTSSATRTASPSATSTPINTATSTATSSATRTVSPSPTVTGTPLGTLTDTPTGSPSPSASPSATVTATRSASPTASPTATPSATASRTPTASPTATASPTLTASLTFSPGPTLTDSRTWTASVTPSFSDTATPSPSASPTASVSASFSPSPFVSATDTPTVTPSWTATPTATGTASATATASVTDTLSPTLTLSPTATSTPITAQVASVGPATAPDQGGTLITVQGSGFLNGAVILWDGQALVTTYISASELQALSPAGTDGPHTVGVENPGGQAVSGSGFIQLVKATATVTPLGTGPLVIEDDRAWPNPLVGGAIGSVAVKLGGPADRVTLRIYTPALVRVASVESGPLPQGWGSLALPREMAQVPSGLYYYELGAARGSANARPVIGRLVVLH